MISVFSCKKKDTTPAPATPTPAQTIVGKYLLTAKTTTKNSVITNELASRLACDADNIAEFTADGKIIYTSGAVKCDPAEISYQGTYTLSSDGKRITLRFVDAGISEYGYEVVELTTKTLKYGNFNLVVSATTTISEDYTYTKI